MEWRIEKARNLFNKANTDPLNLAILDIRQGNYRSATDILRGNSYNTALANILNGNNNYTCNENTAECFYLNAIAGARQVTNLCYSQIWKNQFRNQIFIKMKL